MFNLTATEFAASKKHNKVFPVHLTVNADQLTPIGMYYNLEGEHKFLFESVFSEREIGRYSFLGSNPYKSITSMGEDVTIITDGTSRAQKRQGARFRKRACVDSLS